MPRGRPGRSAPTACRRGAPATAVRGLAASSSRSASRLCAIAALRAPTIASRIFTSVARSRQSAGREHRREQREGQREERVRELDHLERRAERPEGALGALRRSRALAPRRVRLPPEISARNLEPQQARRPDAVGVEQPRRCRACPRRRPATAAPRSRRPASRGACSRCGRGSTAISRNARTSGRRSLSWTSAARCSRSREIPFAIAPSVPALQGMTIMPRTG